MSDLRFARELGAEFERIARSRASGSPRRRASWPATAAARLAAVVAIAVPVVVAVLALALLGHSRDGGQGVSTTPGGPSFGFSGGNCRVPARTPPHVPPGGSKPGSDGLTPAGSGRVSGVAWQLRVKEAEFPGAIEHGRLIIGGHRYGLCSRLSVPIAFGLNNSAAHGIIYGYVTEGADDDITISAGDSQLTTKVKDMSFFIRALPRPACSYRALSVTATTPPVRGLPPNIDRTLNHNTPRFTTTLHFGTCRPNRPVKVMSAHGQRQGRSPNAALARVTAHPPLIAPPGSRSHARGSVQELTHDGQNGIIVLAAGLNPGRYSIWLLGTQKPIELGSATVKHELRGSYDLPADTAHKPQIVVAHPIPGQPDTIGPIVLHAKLQ